MADATPVEGQQFEYGFGDFGIGPARSPAAIKVEAVRDEQWYVCVCRVRTICGKSSLSPSPSDFDLVPGWHSTNGFVLYTFHESFTKVPMRRSGGKSLPYIAYFHIDLTPLATNQTKVTVRTILSEVIDGRETLNLHGGEANHYRKVPPVRQEEERVVTAIAEALSANNTSNTRTTGRSEIHKQ